MILIKNGKVFTMEKENYEIASILIKDGKIEEISEKINENDKMEIIDAKGGWVFPGFIDAHCHIGMMEENMGFEGDDVNEIVDPVSPQLRAIDGINPLDPSFNKALKAGITTVMTGPGSANVVGGQFAILKTHGNSVDEMVINDSAAMKIAFGENPKRCYDALKKSPTTRMATASILRETIINAKNYKKKKEESAKKKEAFDINLKWEAMIPVLNKEIPLKAHAHRADDILTALRIAKEFDLKITLDHCTEGHLVSKKIKDAGVEAIIGPTMTFGSKIELKNKTFETAKILCEEGITFAIMTDHPVIEEQYLPLTVGLCVKEGLSMEDGFKAITINPAKILGIDNEVGSIKVGKDADIVIFDGNPMEVFTNTLYTIVNGKIVYKK